MKNLLYLLSLTLLFYSCSKEEDSFSKTLVYEQDFVELGTAVSGGSTDTEGWANVSTSVLTDSGYYLSSSGSTSTPDTNTIFNFSQDFMMSCTYQFNQNDQGGVFGFYFGGGDFPDTSAVWEQDACYIRVGKSSGFQVWYADQADINISSILNSNIINTKFLVKDGEENEISVISRDGLWGFYINSTLILNVAQNEYGGNNFGLFTTQDASVTVKKLSIYRID